MPTMSEFERLEEKLDKLTNVVVKGFAVCQNCQQTIGSLRHDIHGRSGNGESPGLKIRVDRLEQSRGRVIWLLVWSISVLGVAVTAVGAWATWQVGQ